MLKLQLQSSKTDFLKLSDALKLEQSWMLNQLQITNQAIVPVLNAARLRQVKPKQSEGDEPGAADSTASVKDEEEDPEKAKLMDFEISEQIGLRGKHHVMVFKQMTSADIDSISDKIM